MTAATSQAPNLPLWEHVSNPQTQNYGTLVEPEYHDVTKKPPWKPSCRPLQDRTSPGLLYSPLGGGKSPVLKLNGTGPSSLSIRSNSYDQGIRQNRRSSGSMVRSGSMVPVRAINRLRTGSSSSSSRICSRCSSEVLSLTAVRRKTSVRSKREEQRQTLVFCKLCLEEVPQEDTTVVSECGCVFCKDCMRCYAEFEVQEGAYEISCPDAQCSQQGVLCPAEVEQLVSEQQVDKFRRFRLNREIDMDAGRVWCPKPGCETVCNVSAPCEPSLPQPVRCPTCALDFCSYCKHTWHGGITCEENTRLSQLLTEELGIPIDNDRIKCCPKCAVAIECSEGCAQIKCARCGHVFCWNCLASLLTDPLLRHYDHGPCMSKFGHSRAALNWHRTKAIGMFAVFTILLLVVSPLLLVVAPFLFFWVRARRRRHAAEEDALSATGDSHKKPLSTYSGDSLTRVTDLVR